MRNKLITESEKRSNLPRVMYYEIGRNPYFPKFHGYKAMKHLTGRLETLLGDGTGACLGWILGDRKEEKPLCFR